MTNSTKTAALGRREFNAGIISTVLGYTFLETLFSSDAIGAEVQPIAAKWLKQVNDLGQQVQGEKITQLAWQEQTTQLFEKIEIQELLKFVDFDKLTKDLKYRDRGERALHFKFPEVEGLPTNLVFGHQIFALRKDRSVVPHGHDNMATAFLVLDGSFEGKLYDRLEDGEDHMIIRPTIDETFTKGQASTISEKKDNVHWFKCASDRGFIFNIHVLNLNDGQRSGRVYVDPNGEKISDGRIRAKKIRSGEAIKMYG
ncbi:MAG: hypothetical protein ACKVH8_06200 [Pirellulales bacterium]